MLTMLNGYLMETVHLMDFLYAFICFTKIGRAAEVLSTSAVLRDVKNFAIRFKYKILFM